MSSSRLEEQQKSFNNVLTRNLNVIDNLNAPVLDEHYKLVSQNIADIADNKNTIGIYSKLVSQNITEIEYNRNEIYTQTKLVSQNISDINDLSKTLEPINQDFIEREETRQREKEAERLRELIKSYHPDFTLPDTTQGILKNWKVNIIADNLGVRGRVLAFNKWGHLLFTLDNELRILNVDDLDNIGYVQADAGTLKSLATGDDIKSFSRAITQYTTQNETLSKITHGFAIRHYEAGEIQDDAVTKIFLATASCVIAYTYDDSTRYKAYNSTLTEGTVIVSRITYGIDTNEDYGANGHVAHALVFNTKGDLYITSGSEGNLEHFAGTKPGDENHFVLTDERSTIGMVKHSQIIDILKHDKVHLRYDSPDYDGTNEREVEIVARGVRNATALSIAVDEDGKDVVYACIHGWDSFLHSSLAPTKDKVDAGFSFLDIFPSEFILRIDFNIRGKRFGFPFFGFTNETVVENGIERPPGSLILLPSQGPEEAARDAFGRANGGINPFLSIEDLKKDGNFVLDAPFFLIEKSSAPLGLLLTLKNPDDDTKFIHNGISDNRFLSNRTIHSDNLIVALKGSWNRTRGTNGAGFKLVAISLNTHKPKITTIFENETFSSGWDRFAGLSKVGEILGSIIAPTVYRPLGLTTNAEGHIFNITDNGWMGPDAPSSKIIRIKPPSA